LIAGEATMQEHFDFLAYARQVRKISRVLMHSVRNAAGVSGSVHLLSFAMEKDLAIFATAPRVPRVACGPGCGACCKLNVSVLFPEAIAISRFIQQRFSTVDIDFIQTRLQELQRKTCWLDDEERMFVHEPCAFLDKLETCMIHAVRPLMCRSITSTDAQACRDALSMVALEGVPQVEMDLFQKQLVETVYREFAWSLASLNLDDRPMRLTPAVLAVLGNPELVGLFVSGEKIPLH
jgi:Fe-S-cluster containining protein